MSELEEEKGSSNANPSAMPSATTETPSLLPCAFCGQKLIKNGPFSRRNADRYVHPQDIGGIDYGRCHANGFRLFSDDPERISLWNRRSISQIGSASKSAPSGSEVSAADEDTLTKALRELDENLAYNERDWNNDTDSLGDTYSNVNVTELRVEVRKIMGIWAAKREAPAPIHTSDCAVHNEPAMPNGLCDCGASPAPQSIQATGDSEPSSQGWLIELWDHKTGVFAAQWWSLDLPEEEDGRGWTKDSLRALRFARECDAQAYIDEIGWTEAKPTEHSWGMK